MKTILRNCYLESALLVCILFLSPAAQAQLSSKSLLINHGASSCGSTDAEDHFIAGALTANPSLALSCNVGMPYYAVYAAYNPADHKVYFTNVGGADTKVYAMDFSLPGNLTCPSVSAPTYVYGFALNQLCFDNYGNNYGINNLDVANGTATLMQVDIATGNEKPGTRRTIQFPAGSVPNTLGDGDIVILPNGRMFATFGNSPSMLYELSNPIGTGTMTATLLTNLPRTCFAIGFVDGNLAIAGSDGGGCYYYIWDINSFSLSPAFQFPLNKTSADMSNLTAAIGSAKKIVGVNIVNDNTATVIYQIVVKNKGNITLNNVQVTDDLGAVFGIGNVSNVKTSFVSNPAGLQLNTNYNGTTDKNLLASLQSLNNYPTAVDSAVINLEVTATNLNFGVYYNSAVASGNIGAGAATISVSDSTNNGSADRIDPDGNDVSDDAGENTPTPYYFSIYLPAKGVSLKGKMNGNASELAWSVPAHETYNRYEVERSEDGYAFKKIGTVTTQASFNDNTAVGQARGMYYRIKAVAADNVVYSNTLYLQSATSLLLTAYPNPFHDAIALQFQSDNKTTATMQIRDVAGKVLANKTVRVEKGVNQVKVTDTKSLQPGVYFLELVCDGKRSFAKLVKQQ